MAQLEIDNLSVEFRTRHGVVRALDSVSLAERIAQVLGLTVRQRRGGRATAHHNAAAVLLRGPFLAWR